MADLVQEYCLLIAGTCFLWAGILIGRRMEQSK